MAGLANTSRRHVTLITAVGGLGLAAVSGEESAMLFTIDRQTAKLTFGGEFNLNAYFIYGQTGNLASTQNLSALFKRTIQESDAYAARRAASLTNKLTEKLNFSIETE
ncbi:MAG: hypothetical protein ABIE84_04370 [bacterium]